MVGVCRERTPAQERRVYEECSPFPLLPLLLLGTWSWWSVGWQLPRQQALGIPVPSSTRVLSPIWRVQEALASVWLS